MSKFQKDLTQGSVAKHLIRFSLPFLAANLLMALYNMADMFFVGRFNGAVGATAVGVGGQVTILEYNLVAGLAVGGTILIAQNIGANRLENVRKTIGSMFTLYGIIGAALTVIMLIANPYIIRLLVSDPLAYPETLKYVNVCTTGLLFIFGYNAVSAVLRGMGDSKHPLVFVAIAAAINIGLDWYLCGPQDMGAQGAAIATVVAQGISFVISLVFLRRSEFIFDFKLKSFKIDKQMTKQLFKIGLPSSCGATLTSFSFMVLTGVANALAGIVGNTALSVTGKVNSVAILPAFAMQSSVSSMAGQNIGAGKPDRALKTTLTAVGLTLAITSVMLVLVQLFAGPITHFFIGDETGGLSPEVAAQCLEQTAVYIRSLSWDYLVVSVAFNFMGLAMAAGHTTFSMLNGVIASLAVRVPAAYLLGTYFGLKGMGFAAPIATGFSAIVLLIYVLRGSWRKSKVITPESQQETESVTVTN
ncbi:MAG: MATE family efflux transporter [Oscillospiraceae bacterium]|jgi:putative MATE family efflux protein|nr:MATE family efflux transporter [Oscillospiraceae bacterium]